MISFFNTRKVYKPGSHLISNKNKNFVSLQNTLKNQKKQITKFTKEN